MGFLRRLLGLAKPCPVCGDPNASRNAAGQWTCENPQCRNFRRDRVGRRDPGTVDAAPAPGSTAAREVETAQLPVAGELLGVHYTNFRGEARLFMVERGFAEDRGTFILVRAAPHRRQLALRKSRIAPADLAALVGNGAGPDGGPLQDLVAAVSADQFGEAMELHYTNFQGQAKVFVADRGSARDAGLFVSVVVKPRHGRIALRKTKIAPGDLQQLLSH